MKSVCLESPKVIKIKSIAEPIRKCDEALIRVRAMGICGSDISAYRGTNPLVSYPRIIGHEIAGEIMEVGENSGSLKTGDRVIVNPYLYCKKCYPCSIGRTNCCEELNVLGVHVDGGMKEYMTHPVDMLIPVPNSIVWDQVPLAEPLTIALHAIHRTKLAEGEHIAILGAGTIGLLIALIAIDYGATPILIDIVEDRLMLAKRIGVKLTINPLQQDLISTLRRMTNGRMAEVVAEASGSNSAIRNTLDMVSFAGRIALTGWPNSETSLPTGIITKKELDIRGARTSAGEFEEAIEMIAGGRINVNTILSKVITFDEIPQMIEELSDHPARYLKVNIRIDT